MNTSREVLKTALQMLQRRFYSKQELAEKLRRKGAAEEALQEALTQLEEWNYLNDQRLCKRQVLLKVQEGRYGRLRIEQILRQKGFAGEDVAEAWRRRKTSCLRKRNGLCGYCKSVFVPAAKRNSGYCAFYGKEDFRRLWRAEQWLCTWRTTGRLLDTVVKTK